MSEKKWTTGPWDVQYGNDSGYDGGFWEWYEAGPAKVEVVGDDDEVAIANANLIAAAPDLYDALEELLDATDYSQNSKKYMDACNAADAALAKARGEK